MTLRTNLFPDPNVANTIFKCVPMRCTVDFPTVSGFRWLRATTSGSGDIYAQYQLTGVDLPRAGVYHIHAICYAQGSGALFRVYAGVGAGFTLLYETGIADNQTKLISADITIPANTTQLLIRVVPPSTVGKFMLVRDILLESKSTYDTGVGGGASGLLHRGYDAARIGASVGRVMPDDGHEPMHEPILDHRPENRQVGGYHDHSEQARDEIFGQRLCERHRWHYLDERVWRRQCEPTCQLRVDRHRCRSDVNELFRQVRQSDRHRDQYAHLHVGRVSGEQDPARRHQIFHRGHDAARLTPLGVMA